MATASLLQLRHLDLLRGFVAVGRRMSITVAAEDLCITQSAVSRQVRALERIVGLPLFERGYRRIRFTAEGERLFRLVDPAMHVLQSAIAEASAVTQRWPVTISASIGVTALWLLPRLVRLQQRHPDLDVRVAASNKLINLDSEGVDLAIRYCARAAAPPASEHLFDEALAPALAQGHPAHGLDLRSAVASNVLLEFDDPQRPWLQWASHLASIGMADVRPKGMLRFNQYDQVVQACVAGQGIGLARLPLIAHLLTERRLSLPWGAAANRSHDHAYWMLRASAARAEVEAVADWVRAEARAGVSAA
jgi:DNA-binding transcriptional LysR family regulator